LIRIANVEDEILCVICLSIQLFKQSKSLLEQRLVFVGHDVLAKRDNAYILTWLLALALDGIEETRERDNVHHVVQELPIVQEDGGTRTFASMFEVCVNRIDHFSIDDLHQSEVNGLLRTIRLVLVEEPRLSLYVREPTVFVEHNCECSLVFRNFIA